MHPPKALSSAARLPAAEAGPPDAGDERRQLTDAQTMRAITHPVRLALIESLSLEGELSATQAAELIGESPTTCSFHFRQLANYGFAEEAGTGPGRIRKWRLTHNGMRFSDITENPDAVIAARALDRMLRERYFARLRAFYENRSSYPRPWQQVTGGSQWILEVTPDELRTAEEEIFEILQKYRHRAAGVEKRPDALAVEMLLFAYPIRQPGG